MSRASFHTIDTPDEPDFPGDFDAETDNDDWDIDTIYTNTLPPLTELDSALTSPLDLDAPDLPSAPLATSPPLDSTDDEPWGRQRAETDRQWELFSYFMSLPHSQRTLTNVAKEYGLHLSGVKEVAAKRDWKVRVAQWDQHQSRIFQLARTEAIRDMVTRHATDVQNIITLLQLPFQAIARKLEYEPGLVDELSERDMQALVNMATKAGRLIPSMMNAERLARGMPTEVHEHGGEVIQRHEMSRDHIAETLAALQRSDAFARPVLTGGDGDGDGGLDGNGFGAEVDDRGGVAGETGDDDARGSGGVTGIVDAEVVEVHPD